MPLEDRIIRLEIQIEQFLIHYRMLDRRSPEAKGTRQVLREKIDRLKQYKEQLREFEREARESQCTAEQIPHAPSLRKDQNGHAPTHVSGHTAH
jgi:hypothetical protein